MSFYLSNTTAKERKAYIKMLTTCGAFSSLFSESEGPYISYRLPENIFCKYLQAENISRSDIPIDAKKGNIGIAIKTWIGKKDSLQKVGEFNKNKSEYENLPSSKMVKKISEMHNYRIDFAVRNHNLKEIYYHCVVRARYKIIIYECVFDFVDLKKIKLTKNNKNIIGFTDGINEYEFNKSKSTLYKRFSYLKKVDSGDVNIILDPYKVLYDIVELPDSIKKKHFPEILNTKKADFSNENYIYLPLYSETLKRGKFIPDKDCLNLRFANGRSRDLYEVAIRYPAKISKKFPDFFPGNKSFKLKMPDGSIVKAKRCQQKGKALMSNPNNLLGEWLIDNILGVDPNLKITYDMLSNIGMDSVKITKASKRTKKFDYKIDIAEVGSYDDFSEVL